MRSLITYLLKDDGRSGSVVNGVVTFSGTKKPLRHPPISLRQILIAWERNLQKHGISRNFTFPQEFVREARAIIQDAFYRQNVDEKLFLLIQKLDVVLTPSTYKFLYNYLYKGELDLTTAKDSRNKLSVAIMEGGLTKLLKANEETVYKIPFDDDAIDVYMDGIDLKMKQNFLITTGFEFDTNVFTSPIALPLTVSTNDGQAPYLSFFTEILETAVKAPDTSLQFHYVTEVPNYFGKMDDFAPRPIVIEFENKVRVQITQQNTVRQFELKLWRVPIGAVATTPGMSTTVWNTGLMIQDEIKEFDFSTIGPITLLPGERLFFTWDRNPGASGATLSKYKFVDDSTLSISFTSKLAPTICKAFTKAFLFRKLVEKITGNPLFAQSLLLDANTDLCITCGDAIRGLTGAAINTKLSDFYVNADCILMTGQGIENDKIVIEDRPHFYDNSNPIPLGEIKNLDVYYAADIAFNTIKAGSGDPNIEDVNGKNAVNGSDVSSTPLLKVAKEYTIVSPYKSDPYEIETKRQNLDGKTTTDNNADLETFNLWVDTSMGSIYNINLSFIASGNYIVFPLLPKLKVGTVFSVVGSVSNNVTYTVTRIVDQGTTVTVYTDQTITVSEAVVPVTVTIISGLVYPLKRPAFTTIELNGDAALLPANIFNLRYTPRRIRDAHNRWIRSMHFGFDNQKVKVVSGNRNITLKTVLAGVTVDEDSDLLIANMGDRMILPYYMDFETIVPFNPTTLIALLEVNPNRCFQFTENGISYKGFNIKTGMSPGDNKPQSFKLLSAPDNDLTQKIEI